MKRKVLLPLVTLLLGFSQSASAQYCTPDYAFGCGFGDRIHHFIVNGDGTSVISTTNGVCGTNNYEDFTGANVTFSTGGSYTATINSGTVNDYVEVYIDFDNDQVFQMSESVGGTNTIAQQPATSTFSINIPTGVSLGGHRMRVVMSGDSTYPGINPCPWNMGLSGYGTGEVHDYTAIIQSGCDTATNLMASSVTHNSANISWTAVTGATYEYILNTSPTPPTSGITTSATSYPATGLMSGTTYYFHLMTDCGNLQSQWITISFTTAPCPAPSGINATSITPTSATIGWTAVTGAQGYDYQATMSSTAPTVPGTYTTSTSGPATGLTAGSSYYAWVRTVCGQADTSAWANATFATPTSVSNVGNDNFSLSIYPNPVKGSVNVMALDMAKEATVQLTDFTGKLLKEAKMTSKDLSMDMSTLAQGVYFIRYTDEAHRHTVKVVKE